jgi:hypothetical protein
MNNQRWLPIVAARLSENIPELESWLHRSKRTCEIHDAD